MVRRLVLGCILLVLATPGASAWREPGEGALRSDGPLYVTGLLSGSATDGALVAQGADAFPRGLAIDVTRATIDIVTVRVRAVATPGGDIGLAPEYAVQRYQATGRIVIEPGEALDLAARTNRSRGPSAIVFEAGASRAPLALNATGLAHSYRMNESLPYFFGVDLPGPTFTLGPGAFASHAANARIEGAFVVHLTGATLHAATTSGELRATLGAREEPAIGPLGQASSARIDEYSYATLDMVDGVMVATEIGPAVSVALDTGTVRVRGDAFCSRCDADLSLPGRTFVGNDQGTTIRGDFLVHLPAPSDGGRADYSIEGEIEQALIGKGISYTTPTRLTAIGALIALVLALLRPAQELAARAASVLYTRLRREDVLESQERAKIAETIREEPGIHMRALQRRLGFGWGKLHYHLRVLERAGHVELERMGKNVHAFPSGASNGRSTIVLKARGAAFAIYNEVCSRKGISAAEVAGALGISRQLAGYHLRRLETEGLVESEGSPAKYRTAHGPTMVAPGDHKESA